MKAGTDYQTIYTRNVVNAYEVILAKRDHPYHPYVTWNRDPSTGDLHWGHYFKTLADAVKDFTERPH